MHKTVGIVSALLLMCIIGLADEPKTQKKKDKGKEKAPPGYEDAPEAGESPLRNAAAAKTGAPGMANADAAGVIGDVEQLLALQVDPQMVNLEAQLLSLYMPLLTAELSFIHRVCGLNLEQRQQIKAASDKCLKAAVRKAAMMQNAMMQGRFAAGAQSTASDPSELLHQALAKVMKETLQPKQQAAYDREMAQRKEHRRRVAIENAVALIDEHLVLAIDQRTKLMESLDQNWQASWMQSAEMLMNNNQYLPNIPDQLVVPALTETQKQVWKTTPKQNFIIFGGIGGMQHAEAVDDFPLVEANAEGKEASTN